MERIPLFKVFTTNNAALNVERTLDSGYTGQGPRAEEFEAAVRDFEALDRLPLATMTGTHALDLAYHLAGVCKGAKVISTPMTCTATNVPLAQRGAEILWADVDPETGLIDPVHVAQLVEQHKNVIAVVAVDWAGRVCDYTALREAAPLAQIIQDGAHSFGARVEVPGHYRMWSFGAIKHLNCGGDGGALLVPEDQLKRAKLLRWYGLDREQGSSFRCTQDIVEAGYKYGMNDIAASIGLANIQRARFVLTKIQENARMFCNAFRGIDGVKCLPFDEGCSYWFLPLLAEDRDHLVAHLAENGIDASEVHSRNDLKTAFPEATKADGLEEFSRRQVNIPCGWWLNGGDRQRILRVMGEYRCP